MAAAYTSPYPPPEVLRAYGEVVPGLDRSMVQLLDGQTAHRQDLERTVVKGGDRRVSLGQKIAGVLGFTGLLFALIISVTTDPWAGVAFAGADLVALVGLFVYAERRQSKAAGAAPPH